MSCETLLLNGCEGWSNIAISMETASNNPNNYAFDLHFLWLDPEMLMEMWTI
jgi:hypothetical protein